MKWLNIVGAFELQYTKAKTPDYYFKRLAPVSTSGKKKQKKNIWQNIFE